MAEAEGHQYLKSMNVLKGIILSIIVFGHMLVIDRSGGGGESSGGLPFIIQALYLGLMGYLILSGYFYRPSRTFKENMIKRLKQIGIPLIVAAVTLPLILYVYLNILGYDLPISDYWISVLRNLGSYNSFVPYDQQVAVETVTFINYGAYFLTGMLWGFLIFYGLAKYILDDWRKILITIVILLVLQVILVDFVQIKLPLMMKLGPIDAAFMFVGAWLAQHKFLENVEYGDKKNKWYWIVPIVCFIAGVTLCYFLPPNIKYDLYIYGDHGAISVFPYFIEATLMFIPIAYIGFLFSKIPGISWFFDLLGQHTLGTILLHPAVAKILVAAFGFTVSATDLVPADVPMGTRLLIAFLSLIIPVILCHLAPKLKDKLKAKGEASADLEKGNSAPSQ